MSLAVVDNFITFAEAALAARAKLPEEIDAAQFESALVGHAVVLLHSHMEQCLKSALNVRCARCTDLEVRAFALSVRDEKTGRIGIDGLKGTLKRFSVPYRDAFRVALEASEIEQSWESVKNQRATVAHDGLPATCTLGDLRIYYDHIRKILGYFCLSLGLTREEAGTISSLIVFPSDAP